MASKLPPPVCLALILCDHVHVDPGTGKHTILGTFSEVGFDFFPAKLPCISIFICLTEGYGSMPIRLKVIDVNEDRPAIFDVTETIDFPSPKAAVQQAVSIQGMPFEEPGEYRVQLFAGNTFLMDRMLNVVGADG
jgi:hypothetical protein